MTIGHTILQVPICGGLRFKDIYRVNPEGGEVMVDDPVEPIL